MNLKAHEAVGDSYGSKSTLIACTTDMEGVIVVGKEGGTPAAWRIHSGVAGERAVRVEAARWATAVTGEYGAATAAAGNADAPAAPHIVTHTKNVNPKRMHDAFIHEGELQGSRKEAHDRCTARRAAREDDNE